MEDNCVGVGIGSFIALYCIDESESLIHNNIKVICHDQDLNEL